VRYGILDGIGNRMVEYIAGWCMVLGGMGRWAGGGGGGGGDCFLIRGDVYFFII
jgi:hypothetical protein